MKPYKKTSPMRIVTMTLAVLFSLAFPPLFVVLVGIGVYKLVRLLRHIAFVRRSRDYYLEEQELLSTAKLWRG